MYLLGLEEKIKKKNGLGDGAIMVTEEWKGERVLHEPSIRRFFTPLLP